MKIDASSAAVDNDFLNHIAETKLPREDIVRILAEVFSGLRVSGIIHPLVFEKEVLSSDSTISYIFEQGIIGQPPFEDIFGCDKNKEKYYCYLIPELFKSLTGQAFPDPQNVCTYWVRQQSLGEIHSVGMCLICNCGVFLSDDNDSKALRNIVEAHSLGRINVYNRSDAIAQYEKCECAVLNRKEKRVFSHSR